MDEGLPNITGSQPTFIYISTSETKDLLWNGALGRYYVNASQAETITYANQNAFYNSSLVFDASKSNSIFGNSNTVQPKSLTTIYVIKY